MRSINAGGCYLSNHSQYFDTLHGCLDDYTRLRRLEINARRAKDTADGYPKWSMANRNASIAHNDVIIRACFCIEGFLNYYGLVRLGEEWYKDNLERIGITEKFAIQSAIFFGDVGSIPMNRLKGAIRKLFDRRNSCVHIKSKDIDSGNIGQLILGMKKDYSKFAVKTVDAFVRYLKHKDLELRNIHFGLPK